MIHMDHKRINFESLLYVLAFLVALLLRLYRLGSFPLGDYESSVALTALASSNIEQSIPQTGYSIITGMLFSIFGATNFLARLVPAIAGSLLSLSPLLIKRYIGTFPALILAFGYAFDPSLLAISRTAGPGSLALTFLMLFIGFLLNQKPLAAGISLGLAILGGEDFWFGALVLLAAWVIYQIFTGSLKNIFQMNPETPRFTTARVFLAGFVPILVLLGSLFISKPEGLGGVLTSLGMFFDGWFVTAPQTTAVQIIIPLLSYELFPLVFGVSGLYRSFTGKFPHIRLAMVVFCSGIIISLLYPSREPIDLVWSIVPLWIFTSIGIEKSLVLLIQQNRVVYIFSSMILILLFFMALNMFGLSAETPASVDFQMRIAIVGGAAIVMGLLVTLLVWGWSPGLGFSSFLSALIIFLSIYNLSTAWRSARLGANPHSEIWFHQNTLMDADLLEDTIQQMSAFNTGNQRESRIVVFEPAPESIRWILRNQIAADYVTGISREENPDMVITQDPDLPQLDASYTGQDFSLTAPPVLKMNEPMTWLKWVLHRKISQEKTPFYLWVRSDIFPGEISE